MEEMEQMKVWNLFDTFIGWTNDEFIYNFV